MPVPYCVNPADPPIRPNGQPLMSDQEFASRVQSAFNRWQAIPDASITFAYQGFCDNDPWK